MRVLAVVIVLLLAGCGGGSETKSSKVTATKTQAQPTAKPTLAIPSGKPVPEALSRFRCRAASKGTWIASGYLTNATKSKVTYQVTVYVGEAAGSQEQARTQQVASVAAGGSVKFIIRKVPAPKVGGPCHVQVLAGG